MNMTQLRMTELPLESRACVILHSRSKPIYASFVTIKREAYYMEVLHDIMEGTSVVSF